MHTAIPRLSINHGRRDIYATMTVMGHDRRANDRTWCNDNAAHGVSDRKGGAETDAYTHLCICGTKGKTEEEGEDDLFHDG